MKLTKKIPTDRVSEEMREWFEKEAEVQKRSLGIYTISGSMKLTKKMPPFRVSEEMREWFEKEAEVQKRSLGNLILVACEEYMKKKETNNDKRNAE